MGSPEARAQALADRSADITVLGRDNIKDVEEVRWRTVVIDELSGYKGRGSRWLSMGSIVYAEIVRNVWGMTGTPASNGYTGLWAQAYLLDAGERLGRKVTHYLNRYFDVINRTPQGVPTGHALKEGAKESINEKLEDLALAMTTEGRIELPPLYFNLVRVSLPGNFLKAYRKFKREMLIDLRTLLGEDALHSAATAAAVSNRLSQFSAGFIYPDPDRLVEEPDLQPTHLHMEKIRACREIVDETGSPCLVLYGFQWERDRLLEEFPEARLATDRGVIEAWNRGEVPVMISHPASIGHGLNLQSGGHTMIWTTIPWDLELWQQAIKRLQRQGQTETVMCHIILADHTVDYEIHARLMGKRDLQDGLLDHLESPV